MALTMVCGGGLGNQLFQYAAGRAQARRLNTELVLDTRFYPPDADGTSKGFWLHRLPIAANVVRYPAAGIWAAHSFPSRLKRKIWDEAVFPVYREPALGFNKNFRSIGPRTICYGYFQSYKYFEDQIEDIRREISIERPRDNYYDMILSWLRVESVASVHVRRTDYLSDKNFEMENPEEYYARAMNYIGDKVKKFLVFSDDIE